MHEAELQLECFRQNGYINLQQVADKSQCFELLSLLRKKQVFSPEIFLSEDEFHKCPQYKDVNPKPGRNILENFPEHCGAIEQTASIKKVLAQLLGDDCFILNKKLICGVPEKWIPLWVMEKIQNNPVNNLGAYVKPEFRHITYFYGIDFHQDIIDYPNRDPDFITLYVYLHDVDASAAPLNLLPGTHSPGADLFPHALTLVSNEEKSWLYKNSLSEKNVVAKQLTITAKTGSVALWHALTLHGTGPNYDCQERLSLRYLIAKHPERTNTFLDTVNAEITPLQFDLGMRKDLNKQGGATLKQNYLYEQYKNKSHDLA